MLALAGCGGAQQDVTTEQPPAQETKQAAQEVPKLTGAAAELQALMAAKEALKYQITYDVATTSNEQVMKTTVVQYFDGLNRMRTDATIRGVSETRTYVIDGAATSCAKINNKWTCNPATVQENPAQTAEQDIAKGISTLAITADGTKQLLGKTHNCYKISDALNSISMRYCFSSDGVPVYNLIEGNGMTIESTALLYGKDVAETVWVIPS